LPTQLSWISKYSIASGLRRSLSTLICELEQEFGLVAAHLYGSSLFRVPEVCNDIDVVIATRSHQRLSRLSLSIPLLPPISITLSDSCTVEADLSNLASAGYLLNKFVQPLLPLYGTSRVIAWQAQALASVAEVSGRSPSAIRAWKDEQFPGWRSTHPADCLPSGDRTESARALPDLARSAEARGHSDVYDLLH
jgi:hypothetical protein